MDQALHARIEAALDEGYTEKVGFTTPPHLSLDNALSDWRAHALDSLIDAWPCNDEDCPGKPAWERELDELMAGFTAHVTGLAEDAFRTAMFARLAPFLEAHPEALRTEEAPTAT